MRFHTKVGEAGTLVAPFAGDTKVGAPGAKGVVVKLREVEKAPAPPEFTAPTRQ